MSPSRSDALTASQTVTTPNKRRMSVKPWMLTLVGTMVEQALGNRPARTIQALADEVGIARETLSRRMSEAPFQAWLHEQLHAALRRDLTTERILHRIAGQALAGKLEQQKLWLQIQGLISDGSRQGGTGVTVNVLSHIPRPNYGSVEVIETHPTLTGDDAAS